MKRARLTPIVGTDFIDASGKRIFCLQLCRNRESDGRLEAVAIQTMEGDSIRMQQLIASLADHRAGLNRLTRRYMARSVPQVFAVRASQ